MCTVPLLDNISVSDNEIAVLWDVAPCILADASRTAGCEIPHTNNFQILVLLDSLILVLVFIR
jgi:hypothetical protein